MTLFSRSNRLSVLSALAPFGFPDLESPLSETVFSFGSSPSNFAATTADLVSFSCSLGFLPALLLADLGLSEPDFELGLELFFAFGSADLTGVPFPSPSSLPFSTTALSPFWSFAFSSCRNCFRLTRFSALGRREPVQAETDANDLPLVSSTTSYSLPFFLKVAE